MDDYSSPRTGPVSGDRMDRFDRPFDYFPAFEPGPVKLLGSAVPMDVKAKEKDTAASSSNPIPKQESLLYTIEMMLKEGPQQSEECCIYRVPEQLRGLNPTVYTPMAFPIGPIHNKDHGHASLEADHPELISNRLFKLKFVKSFFQRPHTSSDAFWKTVNGRITKIRRCYAYYDKVFEDDEIFTDMIFLDCIFIIQLFLEHQGGREESVEGVREREEAVEGVREEAVLVAPLKLKEIASDLMLAENQLPFFILEELYQQFQSIGRKRRGEISAASDQISADNNLTSFEDIARRFLKLDSIIAAKKRRNLWFVKFDGIRDADGRHDPKKRDADGRLDQKKRDADGRLDQKKRDADGRPYMFLEDNIRKPFNILDMFRRSLLPPLRPLFADRPNFVGTVLKGPYNDNGLDLQEIMYPTATSLFEAGIEFRVEGSAFSLLDINFDVKKGILYIPKLRVDDGTERKFRNLIAFEQSHTKDTQLKRVLETLRKLANDLPIDHDQMKALREFEEGATAIRDHDRTPLPNPEFKRAWERFCARTHLQIYPILSEYTYITDYQFFMDCLINTPEDVQLLTKAGIIDNWLGSETNLSDLFNSMGIHAYHFTGGYLYQRIAEELTTYHKKRWKRYNAILMQKYLGHPWAILGLGSAILLLILTIAQVVLASIALRLQIKAPA